MNYDVTKYFSYANNKVFLRRKSTLMRRKSTLLRHNSRVCLYETVRCATESHLAKLFKISVCLK